MFRRIILPLSKTKVSAFLKSDFLLKDIPNDFFKEEYFVEKTKINGSIFLISLLLSFLVGISLSFFDIIFGLLVLVILFLALVLFLCRKIRSQYLKQIFQVERLSDLICNEMILVFTTTNSLPMVIEYLSTSHFPIISRQLRKMVAELNLGESPEHLLKNFACNQPSETIKEFVIDYLLPISSGEIAVSSIKYFKTQWRIRNNFDNYINQIEGKLSLYLAVTTIIPVTVSMLLVLLGFINLNLVLILPIIFFVFDLIALEVFNSGKVELLGGAKK
jgi:hypothetical protein